MPPWIPTYHTKYQFKKYDYGIDPRWGPLDRQSMWYSIHMRLGLKSFHLIATKPIQLLTVQDSVHWVIVYNTCTGDKTVKKKSTGKWWELNDLNCVSFQHERDCELFPTH